MNRKPFFYFGSLLLLFSVLFWARSGESTVKMTKDGPVRTFVNIQPFAERKTARKIASEAKPLWDNWYTVQNGANKIAYYNEKVSKGDGKYFIEIQLWRREADPNNPKKIFINTENEGAVALDDKSLTPLFYNYQKNHGGTVVKVDGTIQNGKLLSARVTMGKDVRKTTRELPDKTILFVFLPVLIHHKLPTILKLKQPGAFFAVKEEDFNGGFPIDQGTILPVKPDSFAAQTQTHHLKVRFGPLNSDWWVTETGAAVKIEVPQSGMVIKSVPKSQATSFFVDP